jgi:dTDP-4-amino-4,6-dideoxygalactose transaminase
VHDLGVFLTQRGVGDPAPLEQSFAEHYGYRQAVWFTYGRVAAKAYLETLNSPGQVAVSPFNCVALGNAVVSAGRRPRFVDVAADSFNPDAEAFRQALALPEVGCGMAVSLWGIPMANVAENETPKPILHNYALRSLDATRPSLKKRDAVLYSLNWGKPVPSLRGGFLCGDDDAQAAQWRLWRDQTMRTTPRRKDFNDALLLTLAFQPALFGATVWLKHRLPVGGRLSGLEGATGKLLPTNWNHRGTRGIFEMSRRSLGEFQRLVAERADQVSTYHGALRDLAGPRLTLPPAVPFLSHYPVRSADKERLARHLGSRGVFVSTQLFEDLLVDYPWLRFDQNPNDFPQARRLTRTTLHLPLYRGLTRKMQLGIADELRRFYDRAASLPGRADLTVGKAPLRS